MQKGAQPSCHTRNTLPPLPLPPPPPPPPPPPSPSPRGPMSQVKLTLRPPPNVDFVHGYPGIPPGAPDRPQAAVEGALEVRVPTQAGVLAEWVRIELRKVETLPGGGQANTFYDFVGPSPVTLWEAGDENAMLQTRDFPFSIRIPESIPPSISLENRAGIKYELVASVCTKGKKGFLRRRKSTVTVTQAAIIIDKHELHSTWPVYCQPESRHLRQNGLTLTVDRQHTCYGPGDRIVLLASLKSDTLTPLILRGFELSLRETTIFRAGTYTYAGAGGVDAATGGGWGGSGSGKKVAVPQERKVVLSETKFAVNATLLGGSVHKAELGCGISPNHTTTTLNTARHIDVTYILVVRALLGSGAEITMELPVIVSNWQRNVSFEAIRRIGPAPSLSLLPTTSTPPPTLPPSLQQPSSPVHKTPIQQILPPPARIEPTSSSASTTYGRTAVSMSATLPTRSTSVDYIGKTSAGTYPRPGSSGGLSTGTSALHTVDEMGGGVKGNKYSDSRTSNVTDEFGARLNGMRSTTTGTGLRTGMTGRRPQSARFTIANAEPSEIPDIPENDGNEYMSAEDEKRRLFETARMQAEAVQASVLGTPPPDTRRHSPHSDTVTPDSHRTHPSLRSVHNNPSTPPSHNGHSAYLSAEEEKRRLFNEAQAAAQKTQALASEFGADLSRMSTATSVRPSFPSTPSPRGAVGASMYSEAMSSLNRSGNKSQSSTINQQQYSQQYFPPQPQPQPQQTYAAPVTPPVRKMSNVNIPGPQYLTAEEEKAMLRRYEEARQAVDRTQEEAHGNGYANGIHMPGSGGSGSESYAHPIPNGQMNEDLPPFEHEARRGSFGSVPPPMSPPMSEKERMRRAFEARDNATTAEMPPHVVSHHNTHRIQLSSSSSLMPYSETDLPPPFFGGSPPRSLDGPRLSGDREVQRWNMAPHESELMMMGTPGGTSPPQTPPRVARVGSTKPVPSTPSEILSAVEEKAMMRAKFEADDRAASAHAYQQQQQQHQHQHWNGNGHGVHAHMHADLYAPKSTPSPPYSRTDTNPVHASPPIPPPLMPRPPVEYIQETREEDARVAHFAMNGLLTPPDVAVEVPVLPLSSPLTPMGRTDEVMGGLDMRPFSPFTPFGESSPERISSSPVGRLPGPPPPLPPKPLED